MRLLNRRVVWLLDARWRGALSLDDGIVPLSCPTRQSSSEKTQTSHRQPLATLHGVVFDILTGRVTKAARRLPGMTRNRVHGRNGGRTRDRTLDLSRVKEEPR